MFVTLYADDTVPFVESADDLRKQLKTFSEYCNVWKLKVKFGGMVMLK